MARDVTAEKSSTSGPGFFRRFRRFLGASGGATALEFALVIPPFILMTFGILETTLVMFVATQLEASVQSAARQIRTGNVQGATDPLDTFKTLMCQKFELVASCDDQLVIDVRRFDDFQSVDFPPFVDQNGQANGNTFTPGAAGDIVLVRVTYNWQIKTPMLGRLLADDGVSRKMLMATAAFRNEPYNGPLN